jgi:3-oxoacyl-[acyl-carrier protein] reductase
MSTPAASLLQLQGRVCLVVGASRGIGLATARLFAACGATTLLAGRDVERLAAHCDALRAEFGSQSADYLICDVASETDIKNMFQAIFKRPEWRLDVMMANAGILDDALIGMVSRAQVERVFAVNTFGLLYCAQYASRLMARAGRGGSIINVASIIGTHGNEGQTVYGGSKAAVIGMTKSLAKELAPQNIRVNAIAPGFIDTDMARSLPPERFAERLRSIKMGRIGTADDVARCALFLASDLSTYVTGQTLGVDGGMLI